MEVFNMTKKEFVDAFAKKGELKIKDFNQ